MARACTGSLLRPPAPRAGSRARAPRRRSEAGVMGFGGAGGGGGGDGNSDGGGGGGGGGESGGAGSQRRWRRRRQRAMLALGTLLAAVGATLALLWPSAFHLILRKELGLSPSSTSYGMWKETPVPILLEFYFWNWTNPEGLVEGQTPHLVERGPYVFREVHEKKDVQWHANGTVSYRRARHWFFDAERSGGALTDQITTLNVVALTAAFHTRYWSYFMQKSLSLSMTTLGQRVHETHSVGELLFDGYSSSLIALAQSLPGLALLNIPFDRFGWFYERNGTTDFDGHFTMHTGTDDLSLLGKLSRWNGAEQTPFFPGACGKVNGSAGEMFAPGRLRDTVTMFSPDLCRSLQYQYAKDVDVQGVTGYQYETGVELLSDGEECWCGGECPPPGSLNVSTCRMGAPAFVSYPHFYLADKSYSQAVHGMRPDKRRHSNFITLEPTTGIPLDVAARFQINILLQPYPSISLFEKVPKIYFPMVWFEERVTMSPDLTSSLKILLLLPSGGVVIATLLVLIGAIIIAATLLFWVKPTLRWSPNFYESDIPLKAPVQEKVDNTKNDIDLECELLPQRRRNNEGS